MNVRTAKLQCNEKEVDATNEMEIEMWSKIKKVHRYKEKSIKTRECNTLIDIASLRINKETIIMKKHC